MILEITDRKQLERVLGIAGLPEHLHVVALADQPHEPSANHGQGIDHDDAEPTITWVRDFMGDAELLASSKGTYLNFQADDDASTRGAQYGENLDRLRRVKRDYDPNNLCRLNNNIAPA